MKDNYKLKNQKVSAMIIVSGIIGLITFSFFPLISETVSSDNLVDFYKIASPNIIVYHRNHPNETVTTTIYYNSGTLSQRDNDHIRDIFMKTVLIQICYWGLIIFSILGFIAIVLDMTKQFAKISKIIMLISCITLIASILILYLYLDIINTTMHLDNISIASAITEKNPFKYLYALIILGFFSLTGSSIYTHRVISFTLKQKKKKRQMILSKESKKEEEIKPKKPTVLKEEIPAYEIELLSEIEENKKTNTENNQDQQIPKNIEKQEKIDKIKEEFKRSSYETIKKIPIEEKKEEKLIEKEKREEIVQEQETETKPSNEDRYDPFLSKKGNAQPEKNKQVSSQSTQDSEIKSFDKVLSSVIDKKKKEREKKK